MTTKEAKKVPLESLLFSLGFSPKFERKNGAELWYHSPLKNDKTPSFKVTRKKNTWYDFGAGKGGSIIDFVIAFFGCSISDAFRKISDCQGMTSQVQFSDIETAENYKVEIRSIKILQNAALLQYVENRKINLAVARKYLSEIYWRLDNSDTNYFGVGFKNNTDGYEVRNKFFKGCIQSKNISVIEGERTDAVSIFEGFFDFLALLTERRILKLKTDVIILNSLTQIPKAEALILEKRYTKIFGFLDNDTEGIKGTEHLKKKFPGEFLDMRYLYRDFKDYNEKLISKSR